MGVCKQILPRTDGMLSAVMVVTGCGGVSVADLDGAHIKSQQHWVVTQYMYEANADNPRRR
jgi:hypothetical protein